MLRYRGLPGESTLATAQVTINPVEGLNSISGVKWHDVDGDGLYEPEAGEQLLPGWEIYLDTNDNGRFDAGEPVETTDIDGRFVFSDVAPGTYRVAEVNQPGWAQTFPMASSGKAHFARTIVNPAPGRNAAFGSALSPLAGGRLVIGARFDDTRHGDQGAVYIFNVATGALMQSPVDPPPLESDLFGTSVAATEDFVFVGAPLDSTGANRAGSVYVFDAATGQLLRRLQKPAVLANDEFGSSVAVVGQYVAVGASRDNSDGDRVGAAYLFDPRTGDLLQTFANPTPETLDGFGQSLAAFGADVLVGAPNDNLGARETGAVYLFDSDTGDVIRTFENPTPSQNDGFGVSISVLGDKILIGAWLDDAGAPNAGVAYLFDGNTGELLLTLLNPNPQQRDFFGISVALVGNLAIVGMNQNAFGAPDTSRVHIFDATTGQLLSSIANPTPEVHDRFGGTIAANDTHLFIAATGDDTASLDAGALYVYEFDEPKPVDHAITVLPGSVVTGVDFGNRITGENIPPIARNDEYQALSDEVLTIAGPGVLGNDQDANADPLTAALLSPPEHGTLTLAEDGSFVYTPDPGFVGTDTFVYQALDAPPLDQAPPRVVVSSGMHAPGTEPGTTIAVLFSYAIGSGGNVVLYGWMAGPAITGDNQFGIWSEIDGRLELALRKGDPAPGTAPGVVIDSLGSPVVNRAGQIATWVRLKGPGIDSSNNEAIWTNSTGEPRLLAQIKAPAPGLPDGEVFKEFDEESVRLTDDDVTAFAASVEVPGIDGPRNSGIWRDRGAGSELVVHKGQQVPGVGSGVLYGGRTFVSPVLNESGLLVQAGVRGTTLIHWIEGTDNQPRVIYRENQHAPGTPEEVVFRDFRGVIYTDSGTQFFQAEVKGVGVDSTNRLGTWATGVDGVLRLVARAGDPAPGLPGLTFSGTRPGVIDSSGKVALRISLIGPSITSANRDSVWAGLPGELQMIARSGDQAPGTPLGVVFGCRCTTLTKDPIMNNVGQVAFVSDLVGVGVTGNNNIGLWAEDVFGNLHAIVRKGDEIEIGPDDVRTVIRFNVLEETHTGNGEPSAFNDLGQVAFAATLSDGLWRVLVSDAVVPPPESTVATVTINVVPGQNAAPVAVDDSYSVSEDVALTIAAETGVLSNDSDADGHALTVELVNGPSNGSVALNPDGSFQYTPRADFAGVDVFSYRASDTFDTSEVATVTITVTALNDAPVASDDSFGVTSGQTLVVPAAGVLDGDVDVEGDPLSAVLVEGPQHGTLILNDDGSFVYTPEAGFVGDDRFEYRVSDAGEVERQATLRTVMLSDEPAPGIPFGPRFVYLNTPSINNEGRVAFSGLLQNASRDFSVWSDASGSMTLVARDGDPAVEVGPGVGIKGFASSTSLGGPIFISDVGVAFYANLTGEGADRSGVWAGLPDDLRRVAPLGSPVQGLPAGVTFGPGLPVLGREGHLLFSSRLLGPGVSDANDSVIIVDHQGQLILAAREGDPAPGVGDGVILGSVFSHVVNGSGETVFVSSFSGPGVTSDDDVGLWTNAGGALHLVAREGDSAVGAGSGQQFRSFAEATINDAGRVAFHGFLRGSGVTSRNDLGIWLTGQGRIALVAREGNAAPGTPSGTLFSRIFEPILNGRGDVAFAADLSGTGVTFSNDSGIWMQRNRRLTLVAREGDAAPGTEDGVFFSHLLISASEEFLMNSNGAGQIAFKARLFGQGVEESNRDGIWATDQSGELKLVVREGQTIQVAPDDERVVKDVFFASNGDKYSGNEDGRASGLNDLGQIAFLARFTDGSMGVIVSNAVAFADPASVETVTIEVRPKINIPPIAVDDVYEVPPDETFEATLSVLANDTDANADALSAVLVSGPEHGTLTLRSDGTFSYTPGAGFEGIDRFTYRAGDGEDFSGIATVTIDVVSRAPTANDDTYRVDEGGSLVVAASNGLLANDADPQGAPLLAAVVDNPQHGTLTLNDNGSFIYLPERNFFGTDRFTYVASDGEFLSNIASVTITVEAFDHPLAAVADGYTTLENISITVNALDGVLQNDSGSALTAALVTPPEFGTLVFAADGSFTYDPQSGFSGVDRFFYSANSGAETSAATEVRIIVVDVNRLPIAVDDQYNAVQGVALRIGGAGEPDGLLANDTDPDGDALAVILLDGPSQGELSLSADGSFEYTARADFVGDDQFSYRLSDGVGLSDPATVTISVGEQFVSIDLALAVVAAPSPSESSAAPPESIAEVSANDSYFVEVWIQETGSLTAGMVGGSIDLSFTTATVDMVALEHGETFGLLVSGDVDEAAGWVDDFGGATFDAGVGVAPLWVRLGYLEILPTAPGSASFGVAPGGIQFSRFGKGNVAWEDVNLTSAVSVEQIGGEVRLDVSIVRQPTATDDAGEVDAIAEGAEYLHEWEPYWVEIWVSQNDLDAAAGIHGGTFDLSYDTRFSTAVEVQYGPAFTDSQTGTIDDAAGIVRNLGAVTMRGDVGDDRPALLARVRFEPTAADQIPLGNNGQDAGPFAGGWQLSNPRFPGMSSLLGPAPQTELWAMIFDIDDNDRIDFGDFSFFVAAFEESTDETDVAVAQWADFDGSGLVDFGDFSVFAPALVRTKPDADVPMPPNFPAAWRDSSAPSPTPSSEPTTAPAAAPAAGDLETRLVAVATASSETRRNQLPNSLTTVSDGERYVVEVWIRDTSALLGGIAGGRVNLAFSDARAEALGVSNAGPFTVLSSGQIEQDNGQITSLGGATLETSVGAEGVWARLGYTEFLARGSQTTIFSLEPGNLQFSRFGQGNIPWEQVSLDNLTLNAATASAADLTGNGFVDFEDLTVLLAHWNQHVPPNEGNLVDPFRTTVNFEDLTVLLAAWTGPGPAASPPAVAAIVPGVASGSTGNTATAEHRIATNAHFDRLGRRVHATVRRASRPNGPSFHDTPLDRLQAAAVDRAMAEPSAPDRVRMIKRRAGRSARL
ncbi:MAG: tandem-95 repeat protein [Planctomycetes bacterium]|nr:tandem-95 repeat protein [Planctomycetota bacterium]